MLEISSGSFTGSKMMLSKQLGKAKQLGIEFEIDDCLACWDSIGMRVRLFRNWEHTPAVKGDRWWKGAVRNYARTDVVIAALISSFRASQLSLDSSSTGSSVSFPVIFNLYLLILFIFAYMVRV